MTLDEWLTTLDTETRLEFEERAGIIEHMGNVDGATAERLARAMVSFSAKLSEQRGDRGRTALQSDYPD